MRAPAFWWQKRAALPALLMAPLGAIYGAVTAWRMSRRGSEAGIPVFCIGNFVAGGAGKTPTAIAIARLLIDMGETPFFLSRGYGGTLSRNGTPLRVDPALHTASEVGDEPLLLARVAPTIVAARRDHGARAAREAGASAIVMDDGLQNATLRKDLTIAVVDGASGIGNGFCIPAGPLRAPLAAQMRHADAVLMIGHDAANEALMSLAGQHCKMLFTGRLVADLSIAARLGGQRVVAFAGIGRPEKFFATLTELGAQIAVRRAYADHHVYARAEIADLCDLAGKHDALLVTTEKDAVRIGERAQQGIVALPVLLAFESADGLKALIRERLATARSVQSKAGRGIG